MILKTTKLNARKLCIETFGYVFGQTSSLMITGDLKPKEIKSQKAWQRYIAAM